MTHEMRKHAYLTLVVALIASACGSSTPTTPTPTPAPIVTPTPPPAPTTATVSGRVTATNGGQALGSVEVTIGPQIATSDPSGAFSFTFSPFQGNLRVMLAGASIVPRIAAATVNATRTLPLDAISLSGGFDQDYYRQLVRNTLDQPTTMEPLRRWTVNPSFYMKVTDEAGVTMDAKTLDSAEQTIRLMVPEWTGGKFAVATFERGTTARALTIGWINVNWSNRLVPSSATDPRLRCGQAGVAENPGAIAFFYRAGQQGAGSCRCPGVSEMGPRVVSHELGHAMGFRHAGAVNDVMFPGAGAYCDATLSAREKYHAAIAYSRPVGNRDPDDDSQTSVVLSLPRVTVY